MKFIISAKDLEILRKAVYGLSPHEIAVELKISAAEVETSLKGVLKTTQSKEPLQAMQNLARTGFQLLD